MEFFWIIGSIMVIWGGYQVWRAITARPIQPGSLAISQQMVIEFAQFGVRIEFSEPLAFEAIKDSSILLNKLWMDGADSLPDWFDEEVSQRQVDYLLKLGVREFKGNKGQASNVITALVEQDSAWLEVKPYAIRPQGKRKDRYLIAFGLEEYVCQQKDSEQIESYAISSDPIKFGEDELYGQALFDLFVQQTVATKVYG